MKEQLSPEWTTCSINCSGTTRAQQLKSLRKKIYEHGDSNDHRAATKILADQNDYQITASLHTHNTLHEAVTCNIFRTAYYIASNDRPFTDHSTLIDLQRLNGVDVGRVLHSNVICADIVGHIANEMKTKLVQQFVAAKPMISILIDESTSLNKESCLIVYIRITLNDDAEPLTFFLSIVALNSTTADSIVAALVSCLNKEGFSNVN